MSTRYRIKQDPTGQYFVQTRILFIWGDCNNILGKRIYYNSFEDAFHDAETKYGDTTKKFDSKLLKKYRIIRYVECNYSNTYYVEIKTLTGWKKYQSIDRTDEYKLISNRLKDLIKKNHNIDVEDTTIFNKF